MGCRKRNSCKHGGYNLKISLLPQPRLVQEELLHADVLYPVVILPGFNIVFYDDNLPEGIVYAAQGVRFLCAFFRVVYGQGRLDVKALVAPVRHKVHLKVIALEVSSPGKPALRFFAYLRIFSQPGVDFRDIRNIGDSHRPSPLVSLREQTAFTLVSHKSF